MITQEELNLAQRWAELEPERCERCKSFRGGPDFDVIVDDDWIHGLMDYPHNMASCALRIAVEQSIEARKGWSWKVELTPGGARMASVLGPGGHITGGSWGEPTTSSALLSAYLQALERTKDQEKQ